MIKRIRRGIRHLVIHSSFVIRASSLRARGAFTILELLVVITIIIVLAGLILSTVGYVQKKGARSRAEAEIAAMSAALESYKADNGTYPRGNSNLSNLNPPYETDALDARVAGDPTQSVYTRTSLYLYKQLSGDHDGNRTVDASDDLSGNAVVPKSYFTFKPNMLSPAGGAGAVTAIRDPFGNSYGYSTAFQDVSTKGYNPTFDLWSTGGDTTASQTQWIKNW